jgi:drug/metabolite transporter (DMT)-like permease
MPLIDYFINKHKISFKIIIGGIIGVVGVLMVASNEFKFGEFNHDVIKGIIFCFLHESSHRRGIVPFRNG